VDRALWISVVRGLYGGLALRMDGFVEIRCVEGCWIVFVLNELGVHICIVVCFRGLLQC
jgi:hypothetical protein